MLHTTKKNLGAFTLIEMMAVVVIIGLLSAVIVPMVFGQINRTQLVTAKQDIEQIDQAITMYRFDTGRLPGELSHLRKDPSVKGWNGPYLKRKSVDPWHNPYHYRMPGDNNRDRDIFSLGADGQEGGEGADADIVSWNEEEDGA